MEARCGRCFLVLDYMLPYHVHICFPQTSIRVLHSSILSSTHSLLQYIFAYNGYAHCLMWRLVLSSPFRWKNTQPSSSRMLMCISFCFMQCLTFPYNVSHIFFCCTADYLRHCCQMCITILAAVLPILGIAKVLAPRTTSHSY
jgi:hypothetical protein